MVGRMLQGFRMKTIAGEIFVAVDENGALARLEFKGGRGAETLAAEADVPAGAELSTTPPEAGRNVAQQLAEYFAGERREFDMPLAAKGTEFQQQVWTALCDIPFGVTTSYGELAERLGNPKAVRAVGRANGQNPISIVVPCHRVIGADGSLTGYGGGLERKRALLAHEGVATQLSLL